MKLAKNSLEKWVTLFGVITSMVTLLTACYPITTPIEVERTSLTQTSVAMLTPTEIPLKFVNYVLPPQAKPRLQDFHDYAYFLHTSDTTVPRICVSWSVGEFYRDENYEVWLGDDGVDNKERLELTVDGISLPYTASWSLLILYIEIKDGKEVYVPPPIIDCWTYEPVLGEHEVVFSLRRTNDQIIAYSWKFTVIE